jgi:hypothetical protein
MLEGRRGIPMLRRLRGHSNTMGFLKASGPALSDSVGGGHHHHGVDVLT